MRHDDGILNLHALVDLRSSFNKILREAVNEQCSSRCPSGLDQTAQRGSFELYAEKGVLHRVDEHVLSMTRRDYSC